MFEAHCAGCHEVEGGIGVRLTPRLLTGYPSVLALQHYIRFAMPYQQPGSLTDSEYWDIVAYLLDSRGVSTFDRVLDSASSSRRSQSVPTATGDL